MEDTLWENLVQLISLKILLGLNPYSNGRYSMGYS